MPLLLSRQTIRERVIREAHRQGDTGTLTDEAYNLIINDEHRSWSWLVGRDDRSAIGKSYRTITVTSDSKTVNLPVEFAALYGFRRSDDASAGDRVGGPRRVLMDVALRNGWLSDDASSQPCTPGAYWLEGPSQEWDDGTQQLVPYPQRIRLFPPLPAGESITLVYLVQVVEFGDAAAVDVGADLVPTDLISPPNYDAIVAMVRVKGAARGDGAEEQRAIAVRQVAIRQTIDDRAREDRHGWIDASQMTDDGRWVGY